MKQRLELALPFARTLITQGFHANANGSYARDGLIGHTAYDWGASWGSAIYNLADDAYCYSVMSKDNADPDKYRAVFTLVETREGIYEISYGHCQDIFAQVGKTYTTGELLATVGNTGEVYAGGVRVTKAQKLAGSKAGAHLHGPQVRPVRRTRSSSGSKQYLTDANGLLKLNGYYFEVLDYENGFNGCINPETFFTDKVAGVVRTNYQWKRDLFLGTTGPDVKQLQMYLNSIGFPVAQGTEAGAKGYETEYYGVRTLAAVANYQRAYGIWPTLGYFGPKTRSHIDAKQ